MRDKIAIILSDLLSTEITTASLHDNTDLINEVGLNSLDLLEFIVKLEEALSIEIDIESLDLTYFNRFGALIDFLTSTIDKKDVA